jgi:hypothetical protein
MLCMVGSKHATMSRNSLSCFSQTTWTPSVCYLLRLRGPTHVHAIIVLTGQKLLT